MRPEKEIRKDQLIDMANTMFDLAKFQYRIIDMRYRNGFIGHHI